MLLEYKKEHTRVTVIETSKSESTHDKGMIIESPGENTRKSGMHGTSSNNSVNKAFVYYNDENDEEDPQGMF